ncbi:AMP-binding protein [Bacillus sp. V5-8f]|uniref:AMP-binding protein n=1 Tax=Bacillus sp. V5-8f TaxID=2053044 RepID=UPI000C78BAFB|nr:AMP-binding protein [Bacillus sp. V5-8f]PLT35190.1 AMP-dependent synthetase [Bacillus sp. V5-8f]
MDVFTVNDQPLHQFLRHHAIATPEKAAIIYYGRYISYKELDDLSNRFANFLLSKGIRKGDKVALFLPNCPQFLICFYGIQKIGAIVGPCSPMFKEWELEYELTDLQAKAIIALDQLYPIVDIVLPKTAVEIVITTSLLDFLPSIPTPAFPEEIIEKQFYSGTYDLSELLESSPSDFPTVDLEMNEDVCLIVYTSGSTGLPKGAMLTYRNALYKSRAVAQTRGFTGKDVSYSVMPICHIAGMLAMNVTIFSGGTTVLMYRFTTESALDVMERYHITVAQTVVPMNVAIMNDPHSKHVDFSSLRMNSCTSFGIQLSEEISNQWKELTGVILFESAYGLSETHTADAIMPPDAVKFGTTGKPPIGTEIKIVSLDDFPSELPNGQEGEIIIKSPGVFKGYFNKPEATAKALRDGWLFTGDIGKLDEDGYLYFLGRVKEMIKCSGYSVFPEEVELMLINHPAVAQAAVVGVPDSVRGESVKAFVVIHQDYKDKVSPEDIIDWSREKMAAYKYPRHMEFRESLPKTSTGKLLRRMLKEEEQTKII